MTILTSQHMRAAGMLLASLPAWALAEHAVPNKPDTVVVNGGRPTSLPTQIPTTIEGIRGEQIEARINATDSEDALKYFPSLNVRKRYIGDYDHAVLASRASGTGNSARSLVYADGILLSNLLGNGASFTPRWGMVSPEEIERVDVLYGPFSAAYPGGSVGAVVDFQTPMPTRLEAHLKLAAFSQRFRLYGSDDRFGGHQGSASIGNRQGAWSWWVDVARLDNAGQPISFASKLVASGKAGSSGVPAAGVPVSGALADRNPFNQDWLIIGAGGQSNTVQDHAKLKLAYDVAPTLRASYTLGWWGNDTVREAQSYLRDAAGAPLVRGDADNLVNIGGRSYPLRAADFAPTISALEHLMQGVSLKRHGRGVWDWEIAASKYAYREDLVRTPTVAVANARTSGQGTLTSLAGSGWNTLALKGIWRPNPAHVVKVGAQADSAQLRSRVSSSADWIGGGPTPAAAPFSTFDGNTRLQSLYAQDSWRVAPPWKVTFGARLERWHAFGGALSNAANPVPKKFPERVENSMSPKAALAWTAAPDLTLKASLGRAVRNPTAAELFQGSIADGAIVNSNPQLQAEKSWTGELSAERMHDNGTLRATVFVERTRDALYSQPLTSTVNTVQNIGRIRTNGLELACQFDDAVVHGLSLSSSLTYADSVIVENRALPASVGKRQPRVPAWRATALASMQVGQRWTASLGLRYSGRQFSALDNLDTRGDTYMGVSHYLVTDVRLRYRFDRQWSAAIGIDNLGDARYWAFHPYPQRTMLAELRWDY